MLFAPGQIPQCLGVAMMRSRPAVKCQRELLRMRNGAQVGLDWFPMGAHDRVEFARRTRDLTRLGVSVPVPAASEDERPVVVVCHGLNGGSNENYIRHFSRALLLDPRLGGCRVVVMVARGLCGVPMLTYEPYNAGSTDDLCEVLEELHRRYPRAPLLLAGFSLGANIVCRYVCQAGRSSFVTAALAVNNPFDLKASLDNLEHRQGKFGRYMSAQMAKGLIRYTRKNAAAILKGPYHVDMRAVTEAKLCSEFDEVGSCRMFGLEHNTDYYAKYESLSHFESELDTLGTPTLFVASRNDPMCTPPVLAKALAAVKRTESAPVAIAVSDNGGHLGFLECAGTRDCLSWEHSWMDRVGCEWFASALATFAAPAAAAAAQPGQKEEQKEEQEQEIKQEQAAEAN